MMVLRAAFEKLPIGTATPPIGNPYQVPAWLKSC